MDETTDKEIKKVNLKKSDPNKTKEVKEEGSKQLSNLKIEAEENKEAAENYAEDLKQKGSKKVQEVMEELKDVKEKAMMDKSEVVHPAEKVVGDIISKFKQGNEQINEILADYTKDSKSKKRFELPLVDVLDTNEDVIIIADIPRVKKEDINLGISKNCVIIEVKYKDEPEFKDAKFIINERCHGVKERKIPINSDINLKKSSANWEESKLTIILPKKEKNLTKITIE